MIGMILCGCERAMPDYHNHTLRDSNDAGTSYLSRSRSRSYGSGLSPLSDKVEH